MGGVFGVGFYREWHTERRRRQNLATKAIKPVTAEDIKAAGEAAASEVMLRTRGDVRLQVADLASQRQVHARADRLTREHPEIHVLIHNAAALPAVRQVTPDGFETQMAVNHLAPFTLTHRLIGALESAAPARVISVTSTAAHT